MPEKQTDSTLKVIPLGGLGEIGLNMMVLEYGDTIVVVDSGLMFPEDEMLGIDIVIPDFSYLLKNRDRVAALVVTHGHEDHIGAIPFFIRELSVPIYGTALTLALIKEKLREHNLLERARLVQIVPRQVIDIGPFGFEFIQVCHSIPDGVGLAIRTPVGILIHSGDFKIDNTPVDGKRFDIARLGSYGEEGVLALFSDSTNVEREGYTVSERQVGATLREILQDTKGKGDSRGIREQSAPDSAAYPHCARIRAQGPVQRQIDDHKRSDRARTGLSRFYDGRRNIHPGPPVHARLTGSDANDRKPGRADERPQQDGFQRSQEAQNQGRGYDNPLIEVHSRKRAQHSEHHKQPVQERCGCNPRAGERHSCFRARVPGRAQDPHKRGPAPLFHSDSWRIPPSYETQAIGHVARKRLPPTVF